GYTLHNTANQGCDFDIITPNDFQIFARMCVSYHEVDLIYAERLEVRSSIFEDVTVLDKIKANNIKGRILDPQQKVSKGIYSDNVSFQEEGNWLIGYSLLEENSNINLHNVQSDFGVRYCEHIMDVLTKKVSATLLTLSVDSILDFDASGQHQIVSSPDFSADTGSLNLLSEAIVANTRNITNILQNAIMYSEMTDSLDEQSFVSFPAQSICPPKISYKDEWNPGKTNHDSYNSWLSIMNATKIANFRGDGDKPSFHMSFTYKNDEVKNSPFLSRRLYEDEVKIVEIQLLMASGVQTKEETELVGRTYIDPQSDRDPGFRMPYESLRVYGNTYDPSSGGRHEVYAVSCSTPNMEVSVDSDHAVYVKELRCFVLFKNALNRVGLSGSGVTKVELELYGLGLKGNYQFDSWNSTEYTCSDGKKYFGIFAQTMEGLGRRFIGDYRFRVGPYMYCDTTLIGVSPLESTKWSHERKAKFEFETGKFPTYPGVKGNIDIALITEEGETGWDSWPYKGHFDFTIINDLADKNSINMFWECQDLRAHYNSVDREVFHLARQNSRVSSVIDNEYMALSDTITGRILSLQLSLQIPITKVFLQELISTDQRFNDVEAAIASVRSIAEDSLTLSEQNEQRINEIENAVKAMESNASLDAGIQFLGFMAEMTMPVMGKVLTIMAEQTAKLSSVTARVLGKGLRKSCLASAMIANGAKSRGFEKSLSNIGRAAVETNILFRSIRKKPPSIPTDTIDLFKADKNFVLYDPLEFQKFNIFSAQKKRLESDGIITGSMLNHSVSMKQDVSSSVLTVYHRPLGFLPDRISTLVHDLSTAGLSNADLTARERWLRKTIHPTHSYVTISYDYPVIATGKTRHVITYTGIGDANPGGLKTGDKAAGVGSYTLEYDVIGLSKSDGYRVMELRSHVDCGYTDDQCRSIYSTMFKREIPTHMSLQEAWEEIGAHSRRRTVIDTEIASTPVSLDREWRLRSMLEQKDWDYNLIFKNCQDYAHGLYYYAQGGPVPRWMSKKSQIQSYLDVSEKLDNLSTWKPYEPGCSYIDHGPLCQT
ncbi:structural protein P1, partial [Grapevine Cabernet Sauvignon reovirus]|uniref:structural protein P1 n=1 Tax=Grapevine Cabernet Sauvignon reovirus TaxID=1640277 RepID=UPI0006BC6350